MSSAWTVTAGEMATPALALVGCWTKASWVALPGVTLNAALAPVRPPLLAPSV